MNSATVKPGGDVMLSEEQLTEIDRRVREHVAAPSTALPWEEVRKRLWSKVG